MEPEVQSPPKPEQTLKQPAAASASEKAAIKKTKSDAELEKKLKGIRTPQSSTVWKPKQRGRGYGRSSNKRR